MLVHIDCDLYESTCDCLEPLGKFLRKNEDFLTGKCPLYIAFDELIDYPTYEEHEIKALYEFLRANKDFLECIVVGSDQRKDFGTSLRFYKPEEVCPHRVLVKLRPTIQTSRRRSGATIEGGG